MKYLLRWGAILLLVAAVVVAGPLRPGFAAPAPVSAPAVVIGGINLGNLTDYLLFFADARTDANWQGATKGFVGNAAVDGVQADERTSGDVPYAGTIFTNASTLAAWQGIVDQNVGQAFASYNQTALVAGLEATLNQAFLDINALPVTSGYAGVSSTSLDGLDTTNGVAETYVINVTSGFGISTKINITGDASDVFILRWDSDANFSDGYEGQVKFQSGGAIVPLGGLTPGNFIHVAGDINSSGGGSNPAAPYPQGPRLNNGSGALCTGCADFNGGGFFTGYWLTTGSPDNAADATHSVPYGNSSPLSNGIFVGGWYSINTQFSMTSGTSGVYVAPNPSTLASYDYGDAPDASAGTAQGNYNTRAADSGPKHEIVPNLRLGANAPDGDDGTLQNAAATADDTAGTPDDEDGVSTLPAVTTLSTSVPLTVSAFNNTGASATLACWIDFNRDGDFADTGERASSTVSSGAAQQNAPLTFTGFAAPSAGTSYLRCRLANAAGEVANPTGAAATGEVEDYQLTITTGTVDLSIVKSASPSPAVVGQTLNYTLVVTNNSTNTATGVTVQDTLPAQVGFVSAIPTAGSCSEAAGVITCNLGTLTGGASQTIAVQVTVNSAPSPAPALPAPSVSAAAIPQASPPIVDLGAAAQFALVGRYVQLHNADVWGNAAIGDDGTCSPAPSYNLDMQSPGILHGIAYKQTAATVTTTPSNALGGIVNADALVSQAFADAMTAYNTAIALTPDQTITGDVNGVTVTATHGGQYVLRVTGDIKGPLILNPAPGTLTKFVVLLEGTITLGGSDTVGWVDASGAQNVLIVVKGTGSNMTSHINNKVYGTMLAPYRGATFHGFAGAMIAGCEFVKFQSDAQLNFVGHQVNDWGDAPSGYGTLLANNGPRHVLRDGLTLGATVDPENDGLPTAGATGDDADGTPDDEDAVGALTFTTGNSPTVPVAVTNSYQAGNPLAGQQAFLKCWLDLNGDGDFADTGEASAQVTVPAGSGATTQNVTFGALSTTGTTFLRCRLSQTAAEVANPTGAATSGEVEDHAVTVTPAVSTFDYGDAPSAAQSGFAGSYPTTQAADGARHTATGPRLGAARDTELDGQPTANADGDDTVGAPDDEDGVTIPGLVQGQTASLSVNATATARLDAWIDWNRDGDWGDAGEQVAANLAVAPGANPLSVSTPAGAGLGATFARFRLSTAGGLAVTGAAGDGEVEDYMLTVTAAPPCAPGEIYNVASVSLNETDANPADNTDDVCTPVASLDFGDAPDSYGTLLASNGARHTIVPGVSLNLATPDAEADGQPTVGANGDDLTGIDDEDAFGALTLRRGLQEVIGGSSSTSGYLNAWIDYNQDGDFTDAGEQIATNANVPGAAWAFQINVPANAVPGSTYARFRFSTVSGLGPTGPAPDGEVEDYPVTILARTGVIGDFVWYDKDADGWEDVGEPGIPNVTIDLYLGVTKVASTVTGADGGYIFTGLLPGTYTVHITDLNAALAGLTPVVANQSLADPANVPLLEGEVNKDIDFGYYRAPGGGNAAIGDTVWYDANADGRQQPGEPGIPGVQVCATPIGGGAPVCDTTDSNGHYLVIVPAGGYSVAPTNPPGGYTATTPVPQLVAVSPGQQYLDADFGYDSPSLGSIGNLVFYDANSPHGNGFYDAGDAPLAGISVDLIRDDGDQVWETTDPIIATVTTVSALDASNGNYLFTGLPAGDYLVRVSDTAAALKDYTVSKLGTPNANNNNQAQPYAVTLPAAGTVLTADFGYEKNGGGGFGDPDGVIGNQVWTEKDGDGLFNPLSGDVGQPGVTVDLVRDGTAYATTTTGASGRYAFTGLPAGNYTVEVTDLAGILALYRVTELGPKPGQDHNNQAQPYGVSLPLGGTNPTADFGYTRPSAIGDYVWYDTNADAIQDVVEHGIGGVTLNLYRDDGDTVYNVATDTLIGSRITGVDGGYLFDNLLPGTYFVRVTDTQGFLVGLTHTLGLQSQPTPTAAITVLAGQTYREADFGYVKTPSAGNAIIGDTVWYDANGDGIRQATEPGIAGVQVCATPSVGGGGPYCATTDQDGLYRIEAPAGTYSVAPTNPPAGYTATTPSPHGPITVVAGDQYMDADFGYDSPALARLAGTVWNDSPNQDGLLGAGEPRLPGVSVDLYTNTDGDGVPEPGELVATAVTDRNGDYAFESLPSGSYVVVVSDVHHVLADFTVADLGPNPGLDNNNQAQPYAVTLPAGSSNTTADFGYLQRGLEGLLGVIGNQVWYENLANGVFSVVTDTGVAGVTVALSRYGVPYDVQTTGSSGVYAFSSLPAGNYTVTVTDTAGVLAAYVLTVLGPNPGQDDNHQAQPYTVVLPDGGMNMTADFGWTRPGAIGDFVWYDADGDGVEDVGEPGIPNVTLDLYRNGTLYRSTVTDADGGYLFPKLPPGNYTVDVTDLNGKLAGLTHIVANQSQSDPTPVIALDAGEVYKDADFGYRKITSGGNAIIGDTVWYDSNGDGVQQPGEPGVPGVQVCATPVGGGAPLCGVTDANGLYRIEVPAGSYNVAPTNPPAGTATTTVPHPVTVVAGQQYLDADFGYNTPNLGSIGNLVFHDANKNGVYDAGDSALAGVSVSLIRSTNGDAVWDPGEPVIATVTTAGALDANTGNYRFTGLPAGDYLVHVSDTNAVLTDYVKSVLGTAGADNNNQADPYAVTLPAGTSNLTADFGYHKAPRQDVGVIGNQVWIEEDGNGVFNPGGTDFGQPGVTVTLNRFGQPYATTTTGASGDYSFLGLPTGAYSVTVADALSVLAGYQVTLIGPNQGQDNNNQLQPYAITLPLGGYNLTADFGYIQPYSGIGDTVYYDDDRSGTQNGAEQGIGGVLVRLYTGAPGSCNVLVEQTITDAGGKYFFPNLVAGHYCVVIPEDGATNPFLAGLTLTGGTNPHEKTLGISETYLLADFGYAGRGDILGTVYYDWDQSKAQGLGEAGIPSAKVCLYADANNDGVKDSATEIACTFTDQFGNYAFNGQLPGSYVVEETIPNGLTNTTTTVLGPDLVLSQGTGSSVDNDFGNILYVKLGDMAWLETDGDGVQQAGETTGLGLVPIRIMGTNIIGQAVDVTLLTDANGKYLQGTLLPGTYTASAPATVGAYTRTSPATQTRTFTTTFIEDLTLDFGYTYPTAVGVQWAQAESVNGAVSLSWTVWPAEGQPFDVYRADSADGQGLQKVNAAAVAPAAPGDYRYVDATVLPGRTYWYWLEGAGQRFGPIEVTARSNGHRLLMPWTVR